MESKKDKVLKVIFIISIIPYIMIFLEAIWNSFFGLSWFYSASYGIDAFVETILLSGFLMIFFWPIVPYQIFYLIYTRSKKIGSVKRAIINVISVTMIVCSIIILLWQIYINGGFLKETRGVVTGVGEEIIGYEMRGNEDKPIKRNGHTVEYVVNGKKFTNITSRDVEIGENITIYYNIINPAQVRFYKENYIIFIVILMITGVGLIWWDKKKHAKEKFDI